MSSSANPQHEPTMEEILASIRKIISDDQPEPGQPEKPAAAPSPVQAVEQPAVAAEADVLELTEEVREQEPFAPEPLPEPPAPEPAPLMENDIAFENVEAELKAEIPVMDDLISDSARSAMDRAFAHLDRGGMELSGPAAAGGGTLDALFLRAINDAFMPTLQEWVDNHNTEVLEGLRPLIREWMDENLPSLIEAVVAKEVARASAAAAARPRRR
jgi:cell pole-organizing protein PopZ